MINRHTAQFHCPPALDAVSPETVLLPLKEMPCQARQDSEKNNYFFVGVKYFLPLFFCLNCDYSEVTIFNISSGNCLQRIYF